LTNGKLFRRFFGEEQINHRHLVKAISDTVEQLVPRPLPARPRNSIWRPISFPEHTRSQVRGGHSSGEIELIQACYWLTADSTLDFQREYSTHAWQLLQNINKVFGISRRKFDTFYTEID
jgi:hypothetical protein